MPHKDNFLSKRSAAILWGWLVIAIGVLTLIIFGGCQMSRPAAERKIRKVNEQRREVLAQACSYQFPSRDSVVTRIRFEPGRIDTVPGRTIMVPCPDAAGDTFYIPVKCPPSTKQHDTIYRDSLVFQPNPAREYYLTYQRDSVIKELNKREGEKKAIAKGRNWWRNACLITWGLLVLAGVGWWLKPRIGI